MHHEGYAPAFRKGARTQNAGLNLAAAAALGSGDAKGKGANKKLAFPILQVGGDPFSQKLRTS